MTFSGTCALCKRPAELKDSHILPEFLYRPLYDDNHEAVVLDVSAGIHDTRQKGFSERLLCGECEARFSKLESYYALVWLHPNRQIRPAQIEHGKDIHIAGLDYQRFKLFHLSLLWRMGVSRQEPFQAVRLGPRAERLRQLLLADDPSTPEEFAFFGLAFRDPETGGWQDELLHAPRVARYGSQTVYTVAFAGVRWHYFANKHTTGRLIAPTFSTDGTLRLHVRDWTDDPHLKSAAPHIAGLKPARKKK